MSLGRVYYDPEHAVVFGSVAKLVNTGKINKRDVQKWLSCQDTYTMHKTKKRGSLETHIR